MNTLLTHHENELATQGWTVVPNLIESELIDTLNDALVPSLALRDRIRVSNGVMENCEGTSHHLLADAPCYVELLSRFEKMDPLMKGFFEGNYILNSYGGIINGFDLKTYAHNVHRDIRFHSSTKRFMLNTLVMLDDFTEDNGATYILSGSHHRVDRPADDDFFPHAARVTGQRGSLLLFDSRIWHAAGSNRTQLPRRALTLTFTVPSFKQQADYPRLFGYGNAKECSPYLRQAIGFNARVPASLEEFYVPLEQRTYQRGQD
ncbi:phytanoyl-CoA dioxygenase family protein [Paraburkholderia xenovorans]|uniref:phytanoyl-CoA dioxygenase family protein n=1 Tax=Paraburkholderia xenovorans TaxID=36873 RepID=UPI0038B7A156